MERPQKLRRLNAFRRQLPHVTAAALSAIVRKIAQEGVPDVLDRNAMREARDFENLMEYTPYGPVIQKLELAGIDGLPTVLHYANPFAQLWMAIKRSKSFSKFFQSCLEANPPSPEKPWSLVLYTDEVTPGNPLSNANKRKFWSVYWTFLELGAHALSHEETWFCITTEYSNKVKNVAAGMSQVFGGLLKVFFKDDGTNLHIAGMNLPFETKSVRLFANIKVVVQDGGAHKTVWSSRGDGATKLCLLCKNLFTESSNMCDEDGSNLLVCGIIKSEELVPASDGDLRRTARYLERVSGTIAPRQFAEQQQALGITHAPHSILLDRALDRILKPTEVYMHDWMHTLFVDGVVNVVIYLVFEAFIEADMKNIYDVFSRFLLHWAWPKRLTGTTHLHEIFSDDRRDKHRKAYHIKAQASDLLSILPVLALFVHKVLIPSGICAAECQALLAIADVVDILIICQRTRVNPASLGEAARIFLQRFTDIWGIGWMTPKFHWLLHLGPTLQKFGFLLNCFCLERKHRWPKRYATELTNTSCHASKSLLMEVTSHGMAELEQPKAFNYQVGLLEPKKPDKKSLAVLKTLLDIDSNDDQVSVGLESRCNKFACCHRGDVVLVKDVDQSSFRAGQVIFHAEVNQVPITVVTLWHLHSIEHGYYAKWDETNTVTEVVGTEDIIDAVAYTRLTNKIMGILLPVDYRC